MRLPQTGIAASTGYTQSTDIKVRIATAVLDTGLAPAGFRTMWTEPVDTVSEILVRLSLSPRRQLTIYHLVNPATFSFKHDLLPALKSSSLPTFDVVSPAEWLERLARSEQDVEKNPSVKLIDFWRKKYGNAVVSAVDEEDAEPAGLDFETVRTTADCPVLGTVRDPVSEGLMKRYVDTWMRKWKTV